MVFATKIFIVYIKKIIIETENVKVFDTGTYFYEDR